ncbi:hypothetical protein A2866_03580 [Candidatus Roizmanbacteria bacterium RIFCSPHIGHO2_01_FULL_39_8]|uniref:Uncharacterized protein n=3 Tax=Candidatus Roizmaniibacteriota TaxID=1752723 RepID=A0A1F7GLF7_9BACT|nr:MAG: hypothetical protein A2866_03580 [Candidatus Roizmanbacteria bacterium RIFCSPHIGHO2_01_FULL_39_8]OGK27099.1 MAG: hypothetical protein A3C28_04925 [Candidatus Roizmanbacteria bacterium RIFCSPHIGHO2_02_FULL_39_9]OGK35599.1 MAG: hypothetical protein A3F60_03955 [Candidatus Roizmanbacteria bacterium RIFCSPHIGHO2_12_FULL_39_8]
MVNEISLPPQVSARVPEVIPVSVLAYKCSSCGENVPSALKDQILGSHQHNGSECAGVGTLPVEYIAGTMSLPFGLFTPIDR